MSRVNRYGASDYAEAIGIRLGLRLDGRPHHGRSVWTGTATPETVDVVAAEAHLRSIGDRLWAVVEDGSRIVLTRGPADEVTMLVEPW